MAVPGIKQLLIVTIVNAVTFQLLVDIPIAFVVKSTGPWATGVGVAGTLLFLAACVIYAFPDTVRCMTKARLLSVLGTLLRYLLPWIGLRLLWGPGSYCLCRLSMKLFSKRCHRLWFINVAQFVFGAICLLIALHRTGLTGDFECWLCCCWRRSSLYRFFFGGCCNCRGGAGRPNDGGNFAVQIDIQDKQSSSRKRGRLTSTTRASGKSKSKGRC